MPLSFQTITSPLYFREPLDGSLPIILDEHTESDRVNQSLSGISKKYEDLVGRSGGASFYLPASASPKPQHRHAKSYFSISSPEHDMYVAHSQRPGMTPPHLQHFEVPYTQPSEDSTYVTGAVFSQREVETPEPSYGPTHGRNIAPEVQGWTPHEGPQGTHVLIYLASAFELHPSWTFEIGVADQQRSCVLTVNEPKGSYHEYTLSAEMPSAPQGAWMDYKVALTLQGRDSLGNTMGVVGLGDFTYTDLTHQSTQSSPALSRKRRLSEDTENILPRKRFAAAQSLRAASESAYDRHAYGLGQPSFEHHEALLSLENAAADMVNAYPRTAQPLMVNHHESPTHMHHPTSASSSSSTSRLQRLSPQTPTWNSVPPSNVRSPVAAVAHARKAATISPIVSNPKLCRTSTLQPSPSPPAGAPGPNHFNPYAMLPYNKAMLKINGDLEEMTKDWTKEESDCGRRLVHFMRDQTGSTINTTFKPVTPEDRQPSFICISCIWWEAKNDHYVTSVDTIYLLENLVGGRFTVEEKNRIRRNLEGFRPMTVSKGKSDSEDFFKLIMGFPPPKPRNIEKDVKVFPWKILSHALKKILGKYSASYSSMASPLPANVSNSHELVGALLPPSPHSSESPMTAHYLHEVVNSGMANHVPISYAESTNSMIPPPQVSGYPMYSFSAPAAVVPTSGAVQVIAGPPLHQHAGYRPGSWDLTPTYVQSPTSTAPEHVVYKLDPSQTGGHFSLGQTSSSV